jgi:hypothetical protein
MQPRVAWQVGGYGESAGFARLAKDLGFDLLIRSGDSDSKEKTKVWRTAEKNFGKRKDVLTVSLDQPNRYCWSSGFWADSNYLIDAPVNLKDGFDQKVQALYAEVKQ